jgi:hypothetical protein
MNMTGRNGRAGAPPVRLPDDAPRAQPTERPDRRARAPGRALLAAAIGAAAGTSLVGAAGWCPGAVAGPEEVARAPARAEPTVDELCRAAVALALAEPERARSFIVRARAAGWLPELRFRVFRRFARTEGLTLDDTATTTPVDVSGVDDVRYEWRATWDLSRIVFNPDELQAHAEALRMSDVRHDIQSLVIRLYFERRRLLASSHRTGAGGESGGSDAGFDYGAGAAPEPKGERQRLRVLELEAQLEALSGIPFPQHGGAAASSPEVGP